MKSYKVQSKKDLVKKTWQVLATAIEDSNAFEIKLQNFLTELYDDPDTKNFHDYFFLYYLSKKKSLASSYKKYAGMNTNMSLENLHRKIK